MDTLFWSLCEEAFAQDPKSFCWKVLLHINGAHFACVKNFLIEIPVKSAFLQNKTKIKFCRGKKDNWSRQLFLPRNTAGSVVGFNAQKVQKTVFSWISRHTNIASHIPFWRLLHIVLQYAYTRRFNTSQLRVKCTWIKLCKRTQACSALSMQLIKQCCQQRYYLFWPVLWGLKPVGAVELGRGDPQRCGMPPVWLVSALQGDRSPDPHPWSYFRWEPFSCSVLPKNNYDLNSTRAWIMFAICKASIDQTADKRIGNIYEIYKNPGSESFFASSPKLNSVKSADGSLNYSVVLVAWNVLERSNGKEIEFFLFFNSTVGLFRLLFSNCEWKTLRNLASFFLFWAKCLVILWKKRAKSDLCAPFWWWTILFWLTVWKKIPPFSF